ncbi:MAG: NAD(P)/FAD-dependent oxidoreductase [Clostridiales bacterium]|nr:NAD(P)/FAD-dependent oxidoreductase [Clostridiales bacterium]
MDELFDVIIIGGGPAGLSAAINSAMRGCSVLVLDSGASRLTRAEKIDNYLGMPGVTGLEMMNRFTRHARRLGVFIEKGKATNILPMGDQFLISVGVHVLYAKAVVLAVGAMRTGAIEGEERLLGRGVSYCATCDGMLYKGKKAIVYGISADAPDEANYMSDIGVSVVYVNPGPRPEGLKPDIVCYSGEISAIRGGETVQSIEFAGGILPVLETDGVFLLRDAIAPHTLVNGLGIEEGYIHIEGDKKTNVPGIFACGDCTGPPLQISKAAAEGLFAGQAAARYVDSIK